jgi:hypothetical protein
MISDEIRTLMLKIDENYTARNLASHLLTDDDLVELAELVSQNPYIICIDHEYNPKITIAGATRLMNSLPDVKIINCSYFHTIEDIMEQSTRPRRIPRIQVSAIFLKAADPKMTRSTESEHQSQSSEILCEY